MVKSMHLDPFDGYTLMIRRTECDWKKKCAVVFAIGNL